MTDYPYEGEVQLLGYAWNPDDGPWIRIRLDEIAEMSGGPHPFNGLKKGREKGQRLRMRFDLIADDETTTGAPAEPAGEVPAPEGTETPQEPERLKGGARAKRTGILRNNPAFQNWYQGELPAGVDRAEYTARTIRVECNVGSCAELDDPNNPEPGRVWDQIDRDWRAYSDGRTDPDLEAQRDRRPG